MTRNQYLNVIFAGVSGGILLVLISLLDFMLGVFVLQNIGLLGIDVMLEALIFTVSIFVVAIIGILAEGRQEDKSEWTRIPPSLLAGVILGAMAACGWLAIALVEQAIYGSTWVYSTMIMTWPLLYSLVTMALGHGFLSAICYTFILAIIYATISVASGKILRAYNELIYK
ncbi:hypothetical protein Mtc_2176 [Methanocella conradii HZ254]|uniref:Uncharacterized protein n=1 Tax=Methanocella conradii (strain DSM 24694 / JCM 17849 / CGMCC 1.5162 / HZ254) TaxID=1041930 RepID=H8I9V3_METCZ|nr:hypothetical protein [Methanocella conradii]AFD00913.1 hypothetical protein Mtc_2176 [Methanocella conradii HZ254]